MGSTYRVLHPDGTCTEYTLAQQEKLTLERMQELVGGHIEIVACSQKGLALVVHEEGKLRGDSYNPYASKFSLHTLVGNVLMCPEWMRCFGRRFQPLCLGKRDHCVSGCVNGRSLKTYT